MSIDENAPAVARATVEISASPQTVWRVLTDIPGWPSWNPDVKSAQLEGELAPGTRFRWKAGPGTITSTISEVDRSSLIAWTGRTFGTRAAHVYRLDAGPDSATTVTSEESWDGLPVRLLRGPMQKQLQKSTESGLRALKSEAESRSQSNDRS